MPCRKDGGDAGSCARLRQEYANRSPSFYSRATEGAIIPDIKG